MQHLDIVIPATTEVVGRGPGLAAYLKGAEAMAGASFSLVRKGSVVTVDIDETHGLAVGDQVIIDGVLPLGDPADIDTGTPSGAFASPDDSKAGTTNASIQSTSSRPGTYEGVFSKSIRNVEGRLVIVGGATTGDGITYTPKDNVTVLEVTGESVSVSGGRAVAYLWTQVSNDGVHGFSGNSFAFRSFGASLLEDGRILCTGGAGGSGTDLTGTPSDGWDMLTFLPPDSVSQQSGTLPDVVAAHAQASFLDSADALICGGWRVANTPLSETLRFDNVTQTWSAMTNMNVARFRHELVALDDEVNFLAIGGVRNSTGVTTVNATTGLTSFPGTLHFCELYDSSGNSWSMTGNMTYARSDFGVVKIPDGRVIVIGGQGYKPSKIVFDPTTSPQALDSVEVYNPKNGTWSMLPPMRLARVNPVCTYMPETHEIWVTSGSATIPFTEVLDLATMRWRSVITAAIVFGATKMHASGGRMADDVFAIVGGDESNITNSFNDIIVPGNDKLWLGAGINGVHTVATVPDATHITVNTETYDYGTNYVVSRLGATVTPMGAEPAPENVPGPFSYDVKTGLAITAINGTTDDSFNEGGHYSSLHLEGLDPALDFPDEEGYLVFNFGYKNQVGPVKYLGRLSDDSLILDAAVPFTAVVPAGSTVRLLHGRLPYEPARDHLVGSFYVTGTAAGRVAAQKIIDDIVAAGKQIKVSVIYPGDIGLGAAGFAQESSYKLSDKVGVWGGDELDTEIPLARKGP